MASRPLGVHFSFTLSSMARMKGLHEARGYTKYGLLSYRPSNHHPGKHTQYWELMKDWMERLKITDKNIRHMLESPRRWILVSKWKGRYYVWPVDECQSDITDYILYERKNHPAKKAKGRRRTTRQELDAVNSVLYPQGIKLFNR